MVDEWHVVVDVVWDEVDVYIDVSVVGVMVNRQANSRE